MHVYVNTPQGRRYHGKINEDNDFVRSIPGKYVRWSDKSFCINKDALNQIWRTRNCVFIYKKAYEVEVRSIPTEKVKTLPTTTNEYGEVNIRIPIDDTELIETKKVKKPKSSPRVEKLMQMQKERKEPEQQTLL